MADDYTGMGGCNAKASLKIQALYSVIINPITHFDITSGIVHDTTALPNIIETLLEKELFMTYSTYFDTNQLLKIEEKNFFISRIKTNVKVINTDYIDKEVCIGINSSDKLKVRLVGTKLPDSVAHKRMKQVIANNVGNTFMLFDKDRCVRMQRFYNSLSSG